MGEVFVIGFSDRGSTPLISIEKNLESRFYYQNLFSRIYVSSVCFTRFPIFNVGAPKAKSLKGSLSNITSIVLCLLLLIALVVLRGIDSVMFSATTDFAIHLTVSVGGRVKHI